MIPRKTKENRLHFGGTGGGTPLGIWPDCGEAISFGNCRKAKKSRETVNEALLTYPF
jgi:hypothetical protein